MLLQFTVRGQQIFRVDKTPLASDSRLYIAGAVSFDGEWDDLTAIYLTFEPRNGTAITALLTDGAFDESLGVSLSAGTWKVSAHGSNTAGKEIHTTPILLNVAQAGGRDGEAPPYVPPDAAGQIAAIAEEAREIAQSVRDDADEGLFKGEKGDDGEKGEKGDPGDSTLGIAGAAVGQYPQIAEVDENGVPTKFKAADVAGGTMYVNVTLGSTITADKTYAEMKAAIDAGKNVIAIVDGMVLSLVLAESREIAFGVVMISGDYYGLYFLTCNSDDVWHIVENHIETPNNKVTSLSADSTNVQYPSAKAVYDAITAAKPDIVTPTAESTDTQAASAKAVWDSLPVLKTWTAADLEATT